MKINHDIAELRDSDQRHSMPGHYADRLSCPIKVSQTLHQCVIIDFLRF